MAISFPVALPSIKRSALDIRMSSVVAISENPFTRQQEVQEYSGDRWEIAVSLPIMDREDAAPWIAFLLSLRGRRGTFALGSVLQSTALGAGGGTPKVNGGSQTGYTMAVDGCSNNITFLKAGDFYQIDTALYQCTKDAVTNGSGQVSIEHWPSNRGHADNADIIVTNPTGIFRLASNDQGYSELSNHLFAVAFSAVEAR